MSDSESTRMFLKYGVFKIIVRVTFNGKYAETIFKKQARPELFKKHPGTLVS